ncbi:MAG TPA: nuclease-related domain-containing protein [Candidatus Hydrogenedentes bacterium]|nr:nuclease-related domain-containing protein [Candidatus Hydrogenedentota bacterium]
MNPDQLVKFFLLPFVSMFQQHPLLLLTVGAMVILIFIGRLPGVKGWIGETLMRLQFSLFLPKASYRVINNVTIPDNQGGTTQIDHVIVSPYGIFVVETKHYKGWIFGDPQQPTWTQMIHKRHKQKFQNPLRQNYKHTECLKSLLDLPGDLVKSVVVFTGDCTLKTRDKLPDYVTQPLSCVRYIRKHRAVLIDKDTVDAIESAIREKRLSPGWKTARQHKAYVRSIHATPRQAAVSTTGSRNPAEAATSNPACAGNIRPSRVPGRPGGSPGTIPVRERAPEVAAPTLPAPGYRVKPRGPSQPKS